MQTTWATLSDEFARRSGCSANLCDGVRMLGGCGRSSCGNWGRLTVGDSAIVGTSLLAEGG